MRAWQKRREKHLKEPTGIRITAWYFILGNEDHFMWVQGYYNVVETRILQSYLVAILQIAFQSSYV